MVRWGSVGVRGCIAAACLVSVWSGAARADGPDAGDGPEVVSDPPSQEASTAAPSPKFHRNTFRAPPENKAARYRSRRPFVAVRLSYPWLTAGRIAHAAYEDVFAPGPAVEVDGGITKPSTGTLFLGFQHVALGLGKSSPYADLKEVTTHDDRLWLGWRSVATPIYIELAVGYSHLAQKATDDAGNKASFSTNAYMLRCGGGFSKPLMHRRARLVVGIEYSLGIATGNATATSTFGSQMTTSEGPLVSTYRGALSPEAVFQLAF